MIGFIRGLLVAKRAPSLLIDVQGLGYELDAPMSTFYNLPEIGAEVRLYTHLQIREDAHSLFGFGTEAERGLFRSLIRVSGIGAKLALAILSGISVDDFRACVERQDSARLVRLPGIGKKTAERLIIELRDRLDIGVPSLAPASFAGGAAPLPAADPADEAVSALIALGFKPQEANTLVARQAAEGRSAEDLIRAALQSAVR
ncbi:MULTISPECIES: Holliday junction branch migration protein RuvA [Methylococcus]|jgi:Holliday junction DNA helicase RuvA|uniref:Holliday junction branch migration complex subunit RuvA n=2 Tax=Methylococcus capsulatus TaxID=414 RepID=RUVA_METCA|nr:Holliday junction branch migration protein RuvA [Methylococcus capsulatus]Q609L1.1 RecName: Full=Holliday junction branch migration complex subunit RuvA [Methylococcus capsulatus str. Bath]AAU92523.1 Holliday junction DNA helicase RuvA [Methylococcus capsulatus str. Bath]QXP88053.1 Holliday junction branch migration protein RuvA [Methylococcus capsulatus]QXP90593.1 Holliday junction branch migration protein RuvA [Methylococcus capsulatus]QXP94935.1 Holliday junction branch migration protein